jgi:hypothetical protein
MILSKIQSFLEKQSKKVSKVFNRLSLSGGWEKLALLQNLGCGSAGAVLQMCQCAVEKILKTFGSVCESAWSYCVSLLKNAFKSVRLNCQVAKSPFFSRHFHGCTVFLRLGITVCVWLVADLEVLNFRFSTWFVKC